MRDDTIDLISAPFRRDPLPTFAELRERGSLVRTKLPLMGECWVTTTYEAADVVLRDADSFVNDPSNAGRRTHAGLYQKLLGRLKSKNMSGRDGADHRRVRGLVELTFRRSSIRDMRSLITTLVDRQLDQLEESATGRDGQADFVSGFARQLPLAVIWGLMGLPEDDRHRVWVDYSRLGGAVSMIRLYVRTLKLRRYMRRQFVICRKEPGSGIISSLVGAEIDGDRLSEKELLAIVLQLFGAGYETTVHLLTGAVLVLLRHPRQLSDLLADWSKIDSAVDEILRYWSAVQMTTRYAARDVTVLGHRIERGDFVVVHVGAADADPAQFPATETFDIERRPNRHLAFGAGAHVCVGMALAKAEVAIALERLFTRFPRLQSALPYDELAWVRNVGLRGVHSLPVKLHPA